MEMRRFRFDINGRNFLLLNFHSTWDCIRNRSDCHDDFSVLQFSSIFDDIYDERMETVTVRCYSQNSRKQLSKVSFI